MKKNKKTIAKKPEKNGLKVRPLGDRVLLKEIKESVSETKSGIIIPETVNDDKGAKKGKVMAVGEGRYEEGKLIPVHVRVGDTVLFQWGDVLKIDGEEYTIVNESNIIALVK